jgi:DNA-binding MarR family transcriptional regulator
MKPSDEMLAQCVCNQVRTLSRLVTRAYDDALRPTGLKASQLAVLAAVDALDAPSIVALSRALLMDRTTLSRNLRPLVAAGLIVQREDGRSRTAAITPEGQSVIKEAFPLWRRAQGAMLQRMGRPLVDTTRAQLRRLRSTA